MRAPIPIKRDRLYGDDTLGGGAQQRHTRMAPPPPREIEAFRDFRCAAKLKYNFPRLQLSRCAPRTSSTVCTCHLRPMRNLEGARQILAMQAIMVSLVASLGRLHTDGRYKRVLRPNAS